MKEKILVSACLLGTNCKYSGGNSLDQNVVDYVADKNVILICPEVLGGLSIPRPSCEIKNGQVLSVDGINRTNEFMDGAKQVLQLAIKYDIKQAILKSKSPSCGCGLIYDGSFSSNLVKGNGLCAQMLLGYGVQVISNDDIL